MRQPVFLWLREDKRAGDVIREEKAAGAMVLPPLGEGIRSILLDGRQLALTNLGKVFWPAGGYTKFDLINYYLRVSQFILPHLAGRPLNMKRYPDGAGSGFFFQKTPL